LFLIIVEQLHYADRIIGFAGIQSYSLIAQAATENYASLRRACMPEIRPFYPVQTGVSLTPRFQRPTLVRHCLICVFLGFFFLWSLRGAGMSISGP